MEFQPTDRYIRAIHPLHWDSELGRFKSSPTFSPSSKNKGISVFEVGCANKESECACKHLSTRYKDLTGTPPVFWLVPENLPENITIEKTDSEIDQECHYDIFGFNKNRSRTFFKTQTKEWKGFFYCEDNEVELTLETAKTFYE